MYHMTIGDISAHLHAVVDLMNRHGISVAKRAAAIGVSEQTIKQYLSSTTSKGFRRIPADTLNRLRSTALDAYWQDAEMPYRRAQRETEAGQRGYVVRSLIALNAWSEAQATHPHPMYILEIADNSGGSVIDTTAEPITIELDEEAELRSRWRRAAWQINLSAGKLMHDYAVEIMCNAGNCCPYSLKLIGMEYEPWRIQPTAEMVEAIEAIGSDEVDNIEIEEEAA